MSRARVTLVPVVALAAVLIVAPFVLPHVGFSFDLMQRVLIIGLFGLGFDILFGFTGLLAFGQAAFFGTGGFVAAWLLTVGLTTNAALALIAGTGVAAAFGAVIGALALRRAG
ncbi:MAG: ABC transporter permease subunit, partial [Acetobacteraceae bacterium]